MATPTLSDVKLHMNLDGVDDFDNLLSMYLDASIEDSELYTGRNYTKIDDESYEVMGASVSMAILRRVATMFDSRQDNDEEGKQEAVNASLYTFRQHSIRPLL